MSKGWSWRGIAIISVKCKDLNFSGEKKQSNSAENAIALLLLIQLSIAI